MQVEIEIKKRIFLDCYHHLLDDDSDIVLIWGGRDSGKSEFVGQMVNKKCLESDYFRFILVKDTLNSIKDSQFQTLKDINYKWNTDHLFKFRQNNYEIHCENGNSFLARGCEDPGKLRSIRNPSGAWIEEADRLTEQDWIILLTTLRSEFGKIKIFLTFNPELGLNYEDHWIYKWFLKNQENIYSNFTSVSRFFNPVKNEWVEFTYSSTHTTYHDNPFVSPLRVAMHESLKTTSPYYYKVFTLGQLGRRENKSPFILTFDRKKHLVKTLERNYSLPIILSFDFNRNPMCVSIIQMKGIQVRWLEVLKIPNTTIYQVCDVIKAKYPKAMFIVVGDGSGINRTALVKDQDLDNYYKIIAQELKLAPGQMQYEVNPKIEDNQVLVNYCLQQLDVLHDEQKCQPLIFDYEFAEVMADGKLKKGDRNDPTQQLDALDGARYFYHKFFKHLNPNLRK